ncbi:MAG: TMEM165/GDT1 family protein [Pseudomonadota bacterium]
MEAFLVSTLAVAVAEIGDKTQLLTFVLATRYRAAGPIMAGILLATLANHALAGTLGVLVAEYLPDDMLRWLLAGSFLAMAAWSLVPDKLDETGDDTAANRRSAFWATLVTFFLAEMADKTQVATIALSAQFQNLLAVVIGSTLGMMLANVPVIYMGRIAMGRVDLRWIRALASLLFVVLGLWVAVGASAAGFPDIPS